MYASTEYSSHSLSSIRKLTALAFCLLNNLKIPLHLPVGDGAAELAFFPFAGRGVVVDEGVAEDGARGLRRLEHAGRVHQGARQVEAFGEGLVVGVALDRRVGLDPVLDAPEPGADAGGQGQIGVGVGGGDAEFHAL